MLSDLGKKMLVITARRGYTGADREVFFHYLRGIRYSEMEKEVQALEREGLITIEWVGPSNFTVSITAEGVEVAKAIEEGVWHKSLEALEQLNRGKSHERSILEERGEHSYHIKDRTKVHEVNNLPSDIVQTLDEQIKEKREVSSEEDNEPGIGVPAVGLGEEKKVLGREEDIVERRIEGEMEYKVPVEGEEIELNVGEKENEDRILQSDESLIEKRVKEKRISGDLDTPEFDDKDSLQIEENYNGIHIIDDKISEYQYPEPSGSGDSDTSEGEAPDYSEQDTKENIQEDLPDNPTYSQEGVKMEHSHESEYDEKSNMDLYKQIVDAISLDKTPSENEEMNISTSEFLCLWEEDFLCPLKANRGDSEEVIITPNHCMACQLVQIKKILKKRQD